MKGWEWQKRDYWGNHPQGELGRWIRAAYTKMTSVFHKPIKTYVYVAKSDELMIDDDKSDIEPDRIREICNVARFVPLKIVYYQSRSKGRHIYIKLDKHMHPLEQIALQALMGSDPMREAFSFRRYASMGDVTVIFTNVKWEGIKPASVCECHQSGTKPQPTDYCEHLRKYHDQLYRNDAFMRI